MPAPQLHRTLIALACLAAIGAAQADTVIDNANGYTLNAAGKLLRFNALAFDDAGRIIAVGTAAEVKRKAARGATHIDVQGKAVLPGLIDAHGHVFGLGAIASGVMLYGSSSLDSAVKTVGEFARAHPERGWVIGNGWNQEIWKLGRFPTAFELDAAESARPVWLRRVDGHAGWANSRALALAGITRDTQDPAGGKIVRDGEGNATGVLVDNAMDLMDKVLPKPGEADNRAALDGALAQLAQVGLTSVHDAGIDVAQDRLYRDYADHGKLTVRVYGMIFDVTGDFDALSKMGPLNSYAHDLYALRAVKLLSDGALGSRGAALIEPYSDAPDTRGLLFHDDGAMRARMDKAMRAGYQVNVHAIGDAGNRQLLDGYQALIQQYSNAGLRHRIEHAQVVQPADIPRFKTLGIVPSMQPTHATSDQNMAEQRVGPERIKGAYAWRTFLKQGSRIACGSDFPIESPNPFEGIHAAVTRQNSEGLPAGGWYPQQAMTVTEALRCFTLDAAWAGHQEKVIGSLEKGKWADFIVVDQDLFTVAPAVIGKTQVLQTWLAGKRVFEKK